MRDTLFKDVLFNLLLGFAALIILMLPFINDPADSNEIEAPGNMMVYIQWPPGSMDVDLWVTGPGTINPIGYSNKGGRLWNLLRDDLGSMHDSGLDNFENAFTRGLPAGVYQINIHCYTCNDLALLPVPVRVEITYKETLQANLIRPLLFTSVELHSTGEEITVIRFELDADQSIVSGSRSHFFTPLRSARERMMR